MSNEWSDPHRVTDYLSREIPHRQLAEEILVEALPGRIDRFLDLGTGDGRLISLLREAHPQAHAVGLDLSEPMLARAAVRFDGDASTELLAHDLAEPLPPGEAFDAIVSGLAVHHLEDARKREIFAEIRDQLRPDGVFANLDLVKSGGPQLHERFRQEIGRLQDDPADRLADLCAQLDWLRDAGFENVECQFKWRELALMIATRPPNDGSRP